MHSDFRLKIPVGPVRRIISAPAALTGPEDINHTKTAEPLNTSVRICLEELMDKLQLKSNSGRCHMSQNIQKCPTKSSNIQLLRGCIKEKMWISDLLTNIRSVSRTMEQEKFKNKTSIGSGNLLGISTNSCRKMAWVPIKNGKTYQDWRGVILPEIITPYTMLTNEEHEERLKRITKWKKVHRPRMKFEEHLLDSKKYRRRHLRRLHEKVKRIGPHLEIFEAFRQVRKPPTRKKMISAATNIQKTVRGYLERSKFNRIKLKAQHEGTTLSETVQEYRKMMCRMKHRCGVLDLTTPFIYEQFEDWLDRKRFYEAMFTKRECWKEMDISELPKFFRDCSLFPPQKDVTTAVRLVLTDTESKTGSIKKHQAVEIAFMLYPPRGLKLKTAATVRSTWVRPIINGEDSYKYLVAGHPVLKTADIRIAGDLVAASMRQWKQKNRGSASPCSLLSD